VPSDQQTAATGSTSPVRPGSAKDNAPSIKIVLAPTVRSSEERENQWTGHLRRDPVIEIERLVVVEEIQGPALIAET
jgi:hypothetical protein